MSRTIFVDTSAWVGFFAARDQFHRAAVEAFEGAADRPLLTTDYVIAETVTRMRRQSGWAEARRAWDELEAGTVVEVDPDLRRAGRRVFEKYRQIELSLVDCVSIALMRKLGIDEALTFDAGFRKAGVRMLPE